MWWKIWDILWLAFCGEFWLKNFDGSFWLIRHENEMDIQMMLIISDSWAYFIFSYPQFLSSSIALSNSSVKKTLIFKHFQIKFKIAAHSTTRYVLDFFLSFGIVYFLWFSIFHILFIFYMHQIRITHTHTQTCSHTQAIIYSHCIALFFFL